MKRYIISLIWISFLVVLSFNSVGILSQSTLSNYQDEAEAQYLIISDEIFISHLMPLKNFRIQQGITTAIFSTSEIGHSVEEIKNFISSTFYSWTEPPTAVFLVGDIELIPAPVWENYCLSDNIYGDVDNDDLPEIVIGRLPVNTTDELEQYIHRIINFEILPPSEEHYYNHPLAISNYLNLYSSSWMVSEIFNGWYENEMNKFPVREYVGSIIPEFWPNDDLFAIFGPDGLNYIPETPAYLSRYVGGNADGINDAISTGAMSIFSMAQGNVSGWNSPDYFAEDLNGLVDAPPGFLISMNSLTGKFDLASGNCFAEAYLKHSFGGVGIIAPSEIIYSIGLEWFSVGLLDGLWDEFLPEKQSGSMGDILYPAQALVSAKYFLEGIAYPINPDVKKSLYHLFHFFGEPFVPFQDNIPMESNVIHDSIVVPGQESFLISADSGTVIALANNDKLLLVSIASGDLQELPLTGIVEGDSLHITVTGRNFQRYHSVIQCNNPTIVHDFLQHDIIISPNPVRDRFEVQFNHKLKQSGSPLILNLAGQKVIGWTCTHNCLQKSLNIELKEIENGVYLIILPIENKYIINKFIVAH